MEKMTMNESDCGKDDVSVQKRITYSLSLKKEECEKCQVCSERVFECLFQSPMYGWNNVTNTACAHKPT